MEGPGWSRSAPFRRRPASLRELRKYAADRHQRLVFAGEEADEKNTAECLRICQNLLLAFSLMPDTTRS